LLKKTGNEEPTSPTQTVPQVLKAETEERFSSEAMNRIAFASVPAADISSPVAPEVLCRECTLMVLDRNKKRNLTLPGAKRRS
jgi:hypothetical protein